MSVNRGDAKNILDRLRASVQHEECWTCDCLQGLLTQLELDADEPIADLVGPLKVPNERMHGCLGCDPCPPGEVYAGYLRDKCRASNDENQERNDHGN